VTPLVVLQHRHLRVHVVVFLDDARHEAPAVVMVHVDAARRIDDRLHRTAQRHLQQTRRTSVQDVSIMPRVARVSLRQLRLTALSCVHSNLIKQVHSLLVHSLRNV